MKRILLCSFSILFSILVFSETGNTTEHLSLSSSGGISLGSYQAGRLYYQNYFLMKNNLSYRPTIFTGASAGSINSFLSLLDICQNNPRPPQNSLYWNTWIPIGFKSLIPGKNGIPSALFSNNALKRVGKKIKIEWLKGLDQNCTMYLGIPITLKNPDVIRIGQSLSVQRQLITIVLKISGRGKGLLPNIENFPSHDTDVTSPRLYLPPDEEAKYEALLNVIIASAAFPGAFPSQKIRVCLKSGTTCTLKESQESEFIDGGIYENQPIKLAFTIKKRLNDSTNVAFFRHVDADGKGYPQEQHTQENNEGSFIKTLMKAGISFMDTSRNQELYSFVQDFPKMRKKIISTVSQYPRASDPWGAFFGLFDEGFREFDFLLGIYESEKETLQINNNLFDIRPSYKLADEDIYIKGSWRRYSCLRQFLDGTPEGERDDICKTSSAKNLLLLSQISLWRLYYACSRPNIVKTEWIGCEALSPWTGVPILSESFKNLTILPEENEDTGAYLISSLSRMGYQFDKNEFNEKSPVDEQIRLKLQALLDKLAERQKGDEKRAVKSLGTVALNFYKYLSPKRTFYATFGELSEFGWNSRKIPYVKEFDKFSFNAAIEVYRGFDTFKYDRTQTTIAPMVGGIFALSSISNARFQYTVGLGAGHIFSVGDLNGTQSCKNSENLCKGFILRPLFGVSFLNFFQANIYERINFFTGTLKSDTNISIGFSHSY